MFPLLSIATELIPDFVRVFAGDQSGSAADKVADAIKQVTGTADVAAAKAAIDADPTKKTELQQQLAVIALEETKEQNRAHEEDRQLDLDLMRAQWEQENQVREDEFKRYARDLQDRQEARSTQVLLAEERNPIAWVAPLIAFVLMGLIFYCLRSILIARETIENRDVFNTVLGALVTAFTTVVSFYFGSSAGSREKDRLVSTGQLVPAPKDGSSGAGGAGGPASGPASGGGQTGPSGGGGGTPSAGGGSTSTSPTRPTGPPPSGALGLFRQKAPDIMHRLVTDLGLSAEQSAGILGNIGVECGGFRLLQEQKPLKGGRGGWGWLQWTGTRRRAFEQWAEDNRLDPSSDAANYGYLLVELRGSEAASLRSLRQAQSVDAATAVFMNAFERPGIPHLDKRVQFAQVAITEYRRAYNA